VSKPNPASINAGVASIDQAKLPAASSGQHRFSEGIRTGA
jgi:hypothetical protein